MSLDPLFFALSDPTRRQVLEHIRLEPKPVGEIAEALPVSRPAVSQHLKVLKDAGLVRESRSGTRRIYSVDPGGMAPVRDYFNDFWGLALTRFKDFAEASAPTPHTSNKGKDQ